MGCAQNYTTAESARAYGYNFDVLHDKRRSHKDYDREEALNEDRMLQSMNAAKETLGLSSKRDKRYESNRHYAAKLRWDP